MNHPGELDVCGGCLCPSFTAAMLDDTISRSGLKGCSLHGGNSLYLNEQPRVTLSHGLLGFFKVARLVGYGGEHGVWMCAVKGDCV